MSTHCNSDIRNQIMGLKRICQIHGLLLTINAHGVNLSDDAQGFIVGVDEVANKMTDLEEKRTGERLRA